MSRSINNEDTDWKREWYEEQLLTPEEQKEAARLKKIEDAQTAQILEDLRMMELEEEQEREAHKSKVRHARSYLKDRGWRDGAIWVLSDDEILAAADVEAEKDYNEELIYEYGDS